MKVIPADPAAFHALILTEAVATAASATSEEAFKEIYDEYDHKDNDNYSDDRPYDYVENI